jgi:hypothetical protein
MGGGPQATRASRSCAGYLVPCGSIPRPSRLPRGGPAGASTFALAPILAGRPFREVPGSGPRRSTLGDGSYGSGRALQALTSRFDSGLLHRVRGRR